MSRLKKRCLVDVNVWFALVYKFHEHHQIAASWFAPLDRDSAVCCRVVQLGLFRLLTNASVMDVYVQSHDEAWKTWERLTSDLRVAFADEPSYLDISFRRFTRSKQSGHRKWTDAYLAAFAEKSGLEMVTFDRGFSAYTDLSVTRLG